MSDKKEKLQAELTQWQDPVTADDMLNEIVSKLQLHVDNISVWPTVKANCALQIEAINNNRQTYIDSKVSYLQGIIASIEDDS